MQRVTPKTAINRWMHHGSPEQVAHGVETDLFNAAVHPALGPLMRSLFVGLSGEEPYLTDISDLRGKYGAQLMPAVPKNIKRGFIPGAMPSWSSERATTHTDWGGREGAKFAAALRELSSTAAVIGDATGTLGGDEKHGNWLFRTAMGLIAPGTFANATNPYAAETNLMRQKRALTELRMPEALKIYAAAGPEEKRQIYRDVKDKVFAARAKPEEWGNPGSEIRAMAKRYFNVQPPPVASLMYPAPIR
jgi:hypothetical protein